MRLVVIAAPLLIPQASVPSLPFSVIISRCDPSLLTLLLAGADTKTKLKRAGTKVPRRNKVLSCLFSSFFNSSASTKGQLDF